MDFDDRVRADHLGQTAEARFRVHAITEGGCGVPGPVRGILGRTANDVDDHLCDEMAVVVIRIV